MMKNTQITSETLEVAIVQQQAWPDKEASLSETERLLEAHCENSKPQLVLLQELHSTHYFCQQEDPTVFDLAESLDGPTATRLGILAKRLGIVLVGGIFEKRAKGVFHNTALVFEPDGKLAGYYRKMHIPDDPAFYEKFYFTPGDSVRHDGSSGFSPIQTSLGKLGVLICWDQWYPEAARLMALAGADILLYPTAIGWDLHDTLEEKMKQKEAWTLVQRAHAVANHIPVLSANRTGIEEDHSGVGDGIEFWGGSFITDGRGTLLAHADSVSSCVLQATISLSETEKLRRIWPYFRDRRVDAYTDILKRSSAP